ncbi:phenylacetate-CoA ligase [Alkalihalobacillus xiaoxiensis]|uniref:Phenylacetate-coenzyme A ligase n=1 Tax=Shouchella xiaoxiensis TaxID=766895 RepID=A0ABS2SYJ0_9BACI|nr:AMP-binding protein [Shouchella xiaoxiensis]MBM7840101.1 phenylacetate-CoA ligase [Shouchella xiaoxiensis]
MFTPRMESANRADLYEMQTILLKQTVKTVYQDVTFYKAKFDDLGIKPEQINTLSDLKKLPFTTKQDLRDHYPFGLLAVPKEKLARIHASSGTSGKPTVVGYTAQDLRNWSEMVSRTIVAAGGKSTDLIHNAYGYGLFTGGLGLHAGIEALGAATIPISSGNTERQLLVLQDFQPQGICATPSYMVHLTEKLIKKGIDPQSIGLRYGIFGAEPWSEGMRKKLERLLGIKAVDIYGLSEVMGPGVASECHEAQDGLHIAEDHFITEVIDPITLEPVEEGEYGELVFTSLTKEAMPIIRYRTGDVAALRTDSCHCGRTLARMTRVKGRTDDMLIIRGVNVFPSELERVLLEAMNLAPHYQIYWTTKASMEEVRIHIEIDELFYMQVGADLAHPLVKNLKATVVEQIKSTCLVSVDLMIEKPGVIPRSEGKALRVIDQRKNAAKGVV